MGHTLASLVHPATFIPDTYSRSRLWLSYQIQGGATSRSLLLSHSNISTILVLNPALVFSFANIIIVMCSVFHLPHFFHLLMSKFASHKAVSRPTTPHPLPFSASTGIWIRTFSFATAACWGRMRLTGDMEQLLMRMWETSEVAAGSKIGVVTLVWLRWKAKKVERRQSGGHIWLEVEWARGLDGEGRWGMMEWAMRQGKRRMGRDDRWGKGGERWGTRMRNGSKWRKDVKWRKGGREVCRQYRRGGGTGWGSKQGRCGRQQQMLLAVPW